MHQLSDIIKVLEDKNLIENVAICRNYDTGEPEMHIWFRSSQTAYDIISKASVNGITESNFCPYWE